MTVHWQRLAFSSSEQLNNLQDIHCFLWKMGNLRSFVVVPTCHVDLQMCVATDRYHSIFAVVFAHLVKSVENYTTGAVERFLQTFFEVNS